MIFLSNYLIGFDKIDISKDLENCQKGSSLEMIKPNFKKDYESIKINYYPIFKEEEWKSLYYKDLNEIPSIVELTIDSLFHDLKKVHLVDYKNLKEWYIDNIWSIGCGMVFKYARVHHSIVLDNRFKHIIKLYKYVIEKDI